MSVSHSGAFCRMLQCKLSWCLPVIYKVKKALIASSCLCCSAHLEWNLDGLLDMVWEYLCLTRIYTKPKGMNPDYEDPVILSSKRRTVGDFCTRIHKDMLKQFK